MSGDSAGASGLTARRDSSPLGAPSRYQTVDAWRGIACVGVLVFHSFGAFYHEPFWAPLEPIRAVARHGWLGLHVFFVLSGYCIAERIRLAIAVQENSLAFLKDRALRILPVYWCAVVATIVMNLLASPFNHTDLRHNLPTSIYDWLINLTLTHALIGETPFLLVTWTLTCECVFYLISAGLLLAAGHGGGMRLTLLGGAVVAAAAFWAEPMSWKLPLALWPDFFAGMLVASVIATRRWPGVLGLAILTFAAWTPLEPYATVARKTAMAFAWILLVLYPLDGWLGRFPLVRIARWFGIISYSLYLLHVPLVSRVMNFSRRIVESSSPALVFFWCGAVITAVAGGWLFWRAVEYPCERWRLGLRARLRAAATTPAPAIIVRAES